MVLPWVLAAGAVIYLAVAAYVWRHRRAVGARALTLLLLSAAVWTLLSVVEIAQPDPQVQERWGDVKYLGIVVLPPAFLAFALQYTGRRRHLERRWIVALSVEPLLLMLMIALPSTHDLVRSVPADATYGEYAFVHGGPLFWVNLGYSYVLIVAAIGLLVQDLVRVSSRYGRQAWTLIISVLVPLIVNALYNFGKLAKLPTGSIDPTPIGFSFACFVLVWGFFRFRLHDLVPVGRRQVVERIPDGVVVTDARGIVVDANPAAAHLASRPRTDMIGRDVLDVLPCVDAVAGSVPLDEHASGGAVLSTGAGERDLSVTVSPLPDATSPTGRLVVLRDVTAQRDVERRYRDLAAERQAIIDTLQRGLYPSHLPLIPGVDVAAALDPAETHTAIGGDFVDVRPSMPGRWSLVLGDVVGKGAGAATLTALARHTTVALTSLGWLPSRVLAGVSAAIAAEEAFAAPEADPRFCTVALATLEPRGDRADIVLSLGGHPRPMFVPAEGPIVEVGRPGTLLGVVDPPELYDVELQLGPGDELVLFTDGVVETRRGGEPFGEERLIELLEATRGLTSTEVVSALVGEVRRFGRTGDGRDDVAVLVVRVPVAGES
jgi:serine phosphatase RsbU (regulator of sigma subunit)/PAS domain-containing protein